MIENPMIRDTSPRLSYDQYMTVQSEYRRRRLEVKKEQGCIKPVPNVGGSRFDVKG